MFSLLGHISATVNPLTAMSIWPCNTSSEHATGIYICLVEQNLCNRHFTSLYGSVYHLLELSSRQYQKCTRIVRE